MSFQVTGSGSSPYLQAVSTPMPAPYVSPSLAFSSSTGAGSGPGSSYSGRPPPFSLGSSAADAADSGLSNGHSGSGGSGMGSGMGGGIGGGNGGSVSRSEAKRTGTDPTKYKTTICRNWEQTGACSFRGCTFAHGVDDLRAPARQLGGTNSPTLPPAGGYGTPQMSASASSGVLAGADGHTSPLLIPAGGGPGGNGNGSGGGGGGGSSSGAGLRVEHIAELLVAEVHRERDLVLVHVEANRTLENMLRREQGLRAEAEQRSESLERRVDGLVRQLQEREAALYALLAQGERDGNAAVAAFAPAARQALQHQHSLSGGGLGCGGPSGASGVLAESDSALGLGSLPQVPRPAAPCGPPVALGGVSSPTRVVSDDQLRNILSGLNLGGS